MSDNKRVRRISRVAVAMTTVTAGTFAFLIWQSTQPAKVVAQETKAASARTVSAEESAEAFLEAYKVFMHPRCMNCHPKGDAPLQGDDSHPHLQLVKRGPDGKGKYAMKCGACHQDHNLPGENMPPGNPNWHLLTPEMPMVFEGKSPRELALQMVDPKQNGGKSLEKLYHHVAEDSLVLWGWDPGEGRTKPPLTHEEFTKVMRTWIDGGAVAPK
jgi:hypothetical protein